MITISQYPSEVKKGDAVYFPALGVCVVDEIIIAELVGKKLHALRVIKKTNKAEFNLWLDSLSLINVIVEA